tara:strand:- start:1228 stop:2022 length:795 start_codon:yes stop_codon:yes gene_type:complete
MPDKEMLKKYNENYHMSAHGSKKGSTKLDKVSGAFFKGMAKIRYNYIKKFIDINKKRKKINVLEIGPGPGFFLKEMIKNHPEFKYFAVETDLSCHENLNLIGVNLISKIDKFQNTFDLVIISHVLEHVSNPNKFIDLLRNSLVKNGLMFIEVPCKDYLFKPYYEPHLLFFDKISMKKLVKDFKLMKISYHGKLIREIGSLKELFFSNLIRIMNVLRIPYHYFGNRELKKILKDNFLVNVMIPHKAHIENEDPSWWLRVIIKKYK